MRAIPISLIYAKRSTLLNELVTQLCAALGTTASKHFAAVLGSHSLTEAVLLLAVNLLRLVGSEHFFPSLRGKTLQDMSISFFVLGVKLFSSVKRVFMRLLRENASGLYINIIISRKKNLFSAVLLHMYKSRKPTHTTERGKREKLCPAAERSLFMKILDRIALVLAIIGALNWGSIGVFQFDLVAGLFGGQDAIFSRIIYTVVALAGIWLISLLFKDSSRQN